MGVAYAFHHLADAKLGCVVCWQVECQRGGRNQYEKNWKSPKERKYWKNGILINIYSTYEKIPKGSGFIFIMSKEFILKKNLQ